MNKHQPLLFLVVIIMAIAIFVGLKLIKENQDIRNRANYQDPCRLCVGIECVVMGTPPFCNVNLNQCQQNQDCQNAGAPTPLADVVPKPQPAQKSFWQVVVDFFLKIIPFKF